MNQKKYCSPGHLVPSEASSPLLSTLVTSTLLTNQVLVRFSLNIPRYTYSSYFYRPLYNSKCPKKWDQNRFFNHYATQSIIIGQESCHRLLCSGTSGHAANNQRVICEQHAGNRHIYVHEHTVGSGRQRRRQLQECGSGRLAPRYVVCPEDGGICVTTTICDVTISDASEHGPSSPILADWIASLS